MANKMKICVPRVNPVLFHFKPRADNDWIINLAAVSGRSRSGRSSEGRIDGVEYLETILKDAKENYSVDILNIPKKAVIRDGSK